MTISFLKQEGVKEQGAGRTEQKLVQHIVKPVLQKKQDGACRDPCAYVLFYVLACGFYISVTCRLAFVLAPTGTFDTPEWKGQSGTNYVHIGDGDLSKYTEKAFAERKQGKLDQKVSLPHLIQVGS